ncbi:hypothetical protein OPV22_006722 [Ensete ventricosum]|uniref:RING-type E3 ubiquitin transferase n=1 Tax=Ensete ventricosum TaxID=4639 RepID=A0AAV8RLG5_ENSVE|nr:hypothetical protein OPV22_006722 [Ensete ventricosum]
MEEPLVARYWCHRWMDPPRGHADTPLDPASHRASSPWTPFLLGLLGGGSLRRRRGPHREGEAEEDEVEHSNRDPDSQVAAAERPQGSFAVLQLLQALGRSDSEGDRERVILINPFTQAIIIQANQPQTQTPGGISDGASSSEDYFLGTRSGLDLLLQHLAENDPNRYGTPPARKEALDAMPTVKVEENTSCPVCLEDMDVGAEAREMPCKHKFHGECILPWLELHSSCPLCRFQLPADESKVPSAGGGGSNTDGGSRQSARWLWIPVSWPFAGLFSLSLASQSHGNSSSTPPSSTSGATESELNHHSRRYFFYSSKSDGLFVVLYIMYARRWSL